MTQQKSEDPAIKAARINRTGTVVATIATALITTIATGVTAYLVGRNEGVAAAPPVTVTKTVTAPGTGGTRNGSEPGTTTNQAPAGGDSLLELDAIESDGEFVTDPQKVNTRAYDRALTVWIGVCGDDNSATRTYQLDRQYQRLRATVGLADGSKSGAVVRFRVVLDGKVIETATARLGPGDDRPLDVDLTNAFRLRLEAELEGGVCYNEYQAGAVWVDPKVT